MHTRSINVPRPRKRRFCRDFEGDRVFKPRSIPMRRLRTVRLELSELEAMRLCDLDGLDQLQSGRLMARVVDRERWPS